MDRTDIILPIVQLGPYFSEWGKFDAAEEVLKLNYYHVWTVGDQELKAVKKIRFRYDDGHGQKFFDVTYHYFPHS
jgi:hypothetical protein